MDLFERTIQADSARFWIYGLRRFQTAEVSVSPPKYRFPKLKTVECAFAVAVGLSLIVNEFTLRLEPCGFPFKTYYSDLL